MKTKSVEQQFFRYVSQHVVGMIGISAYVLADVFFISKYAGADGIAGLNLILPVYSLIFAIGELLGVGGATRYTIDSARQEPEKEYYFSNAIIWALICSIPFMVVGMVDPGSVARLFGADKVLEAVITDYTRLFMCFTPFFMISHIMTAFVRNDGAPRVAMLATLSSNLFNIVFDYIFIFPMGLGMAGAALATIIAPILAIVIDCGHLLSKRGHLRWTWGGWKIRRLIRMCQLGVSAFIGELAGGVVTVVFNFLILGLAGNTGVAAYGIICNVAIVGTAIFNGIAQGGQPLLSHYYGKSDYKTVGRIFRLALLSALVVAVLLEGSAILLGDRVIAIFNSRNNALLADYASLGMKLYFAGFLFSGVNMAATAYFSAVEQPLNAFVLSISRGVVVITICGIVMGRLFGMSGVWLSYGAAECITLILFLILNRRRGK